MMKEKNFKKIDTVPEMLEAFQGNPLYQTLDVVTGLLGNPTRLMKNFSHESNDSLVLVARIDKIRIFIADCENWSNKLKICVDEAVKDEAVFENPFFNTLFFETLPAVIVLLKSVTQGMFLPCELHRLPFFSVTVKKLNRFFEACAALEVKLDQLAEGFKKE